MKEEEFNKRFIIVLLLIFLLAIITFEAFQQLFYIQRFDLENTNNISIFRLLRAQLYRWGIWLALTPFLWMLSIRKSVKIKFTSKDLLHYIGSILLLVFVAIVIISIINVVINQGTFSEFSSNYLPFFIYQKGLVFTLGYAAVSVILYQYFANKQLQIKVQELSEVKNINQDLYKKLKNENEDTSSILNIKIGNKHKIIPIKNIRWIESDDYCVKIHTDNDISYSMRSSLKSLEDKLSTNNFLRVHRNALVNMKMAKEMDFSNTPKLILEDATEVLISKSKIKKVRDFLK